MKTVIANLESVTTYSQSKYFAPEKQQGENERDHEARMWRERLHYDPSSLEVFIPPMAFKNCLQDAARYLSLQIPGKGKATYTKHFEAGVLVANPLMLGVKRDDVQGQWLMVPSDGKPGGSKRVPKCFPIIPQWSGEVEFMIFDETVLGIYGEANGRKITAFEHVLTEAGKFIGIGYFRPRNRGFWGRFAVKSIKVS